MIGFSDTVAPYPYRSLCMRLFYTLLIYLLSPVVLFLLYRPRHGKPGFGPRWKEHLGWVAPPNKQAPIWIHAVSVGETIAVTPLIKTLKQRHPEFVTFWKNTVSFLLGLPLATSAGSGQRLRQLAAELWEKSCAAGGTSRAEW